MKKPSVNNNALWQAAAWYVQKYGGTSTSLREALKRRLHRAMLEPDVYEERLLEINKIVQTFQDLGYINDLEWTEFKVKSLLSKGVPTRSIAQRLRQKGISQEIADQVLNSLCEDSDRRAAIAYIKRRRLGPYRPDEQKKLLRQKDLAAMARAGFSYALAKELLEADFEELQ